MGRGSICTWQDYGRRSSNMQQFSTNRAEFMTDDIEYKRDDGWFLSYTRLAAVIVVFIIGVIAAGFIGWYINFLQNAKQSSETPSVISDEIDEDVIVDMTISPFVHPSKYRLTLTPVYEGNVVSKMEGRVVIEFRIGGTPGLSKLCLNAKNVTVTGYNLTSLERDDETGAASPENLTTSLGTRAADIKISRYDIDEEKELHTIELQEEAAEGNYSLSIDYEVSLDSGAFYVANFSQTDGEKWLIGTRLKPLGARSLMPVFDELGSKSLFTVSVARPKEMRVLSNMPLRSSGDTGNSVIDTFDETPWLSSWNFGFAMGHIEAVAKTAINGSVVTTFWAGRETDPLGIYLIGKLEPAVISLTDMFSMGYPLPKLDLLVLPPGIDGNIGKPGLISLKESIFYTEEDSGPVTRNDALKDLVYLLAEQWLGGIVNMNWTDAWILEGTLLNVQYELVEKIDSSLISANSFVTDVLVDSMEADGFSISWPLETNVNNFYQSPFNNRDAKGACLIRMLRGAINDTAFWNGYQKFIERKYDTADAAEFWNIMAEEANGLPAGVTLAELMTPWISQSGYPVVVITRNYEKGSAVIRQVLLDQHGIVYKSYTSLQERFTYDPLLSVSDNLWYIPLTYTSDTGNRSDQEVIWFQSELEIPLNEAAENGSWILFNINKTGYYRVHYDEENWMLLKAALEENHELFPAETKASLIDDVFSLAAVGLAKYETAFDFIKYMQMKERHYAPWGALMRQVFKLNRLLYETSAFISFQEFMLRFISPLYDEMKHRVDEGTPLPLIAVQMACAFEHSECLDWFSNIFNNLDENVDIRSFMPVYLHETLYCTIARYGARKEWNYFIERQAVIANEQEKKHLLSSFSCFQIPWILQTILNEILSGNLFTEDEVLAILNTFPQNSAAAQAAFKFIRTNWPEIVERYSKSHTVLKAFAFSMFNGVTTQEDLQDLQKFREDNINILKGVVHPTAIVEANANFVWSWTKNSLPEVEKLLGRNSSEDGTLRTF